MQQFTSVHHRVLVVDSDAQVGAEFRRAAEGLPLTVEVALCASSAWRALARGAPAAVFADLWLDGSDGLSLLEQVGQRFPGVARVLYTGGVAQRRGLDIPVLGKPCEPQALRELLSSFLPLGR